MFKITFLKYILQKITLYKTIRSRRWNTKILVEYRNEPSMNPWIPVPTSDSLTINTSQWPKNSSTHAMYKKKNENSTMKTDYLMRFLFLCKSSSSFLPSVVVRPGSASTTHQSRSVSPHVFNCAPVANYFTTTTTHLPTYGLHRVLCHSFQHPYHPPPRHEEWEKSYYRTCPVQCSVGRSQQWEIAIYISSGWWPNSSAPPHPPSSAGQVLYRGESQGNPTNIIYCIVTDFY